MSQEIAGPLDWDADARKDLEKETIYLRERLRQRVEAVARESDLTRVTLDLVKQVRQPLATATVVRGRRLTPPPEPEPAPPWPVTFGSYRLVDLEGSVAICTLASEALVEELAPVAPKGVAIVGRVFTENFGVEKLVTNIVANPRLRTLVLCGTESRHRVGQTLLALHTNGRDSDGRVIGSESPQPIVRSLSDEAVQIYQEKLTIVDLRGQDAAGPILATAQQAATSEPWPTTWEPPVPTLRLGANATGGMGGGHRRFTPDSTGLFLIGIGPWRDTIELEHYTHEGYLDYRLVGASADALCRALITRGLVNDLGHALYVGREVQKAEVALRLRLEYEQDRALTPSPTLG